MKKRHSIATRIFALFLLLTTLAGSIVMSNFISLQNFTTASENWVQQQLPALVSAAQFAEIGGIITTDATNLALAKTPQALNLAHNNLQQALPQLVPSSTNHLTLQRHQEMFALSNGLDDNIDKIFINTRQKLLIKGLQKQLRQQLYWLQIDFVDEVIPLTKESQFNLNLLMDKFQRQQQLSPSEFQTLRFESDTQHQLLKLEADVNLVLDLLQRVSLFSTRTDILAAQSMIDETMVTISQQIHYLLALPSTVTIRQIALQLTDYISSADNTIERSLRVLSLDERNQELLIENQRLIQRIRLIVSQTIDDAEQQASKTAQQLEYSIESSRTQLQLTLAIMIVMAIFVGGYLRIQLLNRLASVLRSMRHLAQGEAQAPLRLKGQDEMASLAHATNVFNETAQQLRQHSQALEDKNRQLETEIQQRKQAELELKDTQQELVQAAKLAVLGQLTTGIVHEFSQPLTAIRSNSYLAEQYLKQQQPDLAKEKIQRIDRITERATKLCQHLKSFARKSDDIGQRTQILTTVNHAIDLFTDNLPPHWLTVSIEQDLYVAANETRLEQVFVNIIGNGIDAIETRLLGEDFSPVIALSVKKDAEHVYMTLQDNGCGMTQAQQEQVFEPFFTTKDVGKGLGLGMSITHNIVHDFGGSIAITSAENNGTKVVLCLKRM